MAGVWLGSKEPTPDQQAVRAGTPETWDVVDDGSRFSVLVVPLPDVDQAIVYSPRLARGWSPILIDKRLSVPYCEDLGEVRRLLDIPVWRIDGTHLTFIWMLQSAQDVLGLEKGRYENEPFDPLPAPTINVAPWRKALTDGIDDTRKRRLALQHKLPFLERDLKSTEETLSGDRKSAAKPGPPDETLEDSIRILSERRDELKREIAKVRSKLDDTD